jgi:error-prone DNA polymerase
MELLPAYAELHCLSNFSFLRGASHPEELVERAKAQGYGALALTDECSLAGAVRAHLAARDAGLPLILGSELTLDDGTKLVLLATDRASYGDLCELVTRGWRRAQKGRYALSRDDVGALGSRCLALWLPPMHPRIEPDAACLATGGFVADTFRGRAWIGVELFAGAGDRLRLAHFAALSRATGLPLVASGDAHMHVRARRALQDTLTAIRRRTPLAHCGHALFPNGERHLRSRALLAGVYPPELLAETLRVAER